MYMAETACRQPTQFDKRSRPSEVIQDMHAFLWLICDVLLELFSHQFADAEL